MGSLKDNKTMYLDEGGVRVLINKISELNLGIQGNLEGGIKLMGTVGSPNELPTKDVPKGHMYHVTSDDAFWFYDGNKWNRIDSNIDWGGDNL